MVGWSFFYGASDPMTETLLILPFLAWRGAGRSRQQEGGEEEEEEEEEREMEAYLSQQAAEGSD